jgi:hypothetical protein
VAEAVGKPQRRGWGWRSNLAAGLVVALVGALLLTGQATKNGVPIPPALGVVLIALGVAVAAGLLDRLRRPA